MAHLGDAAAKLFSDVNYAQLATIRPDGTAQVTPIWVHTDGEKVYFNTARGRAKHRNIDRDPRVTIHVSNNQNPFEYVSVTGCAEMTEEGADEHINSLSAKYIGQDPYPYKQPGEVRVKVVVRPDKVDYFSMG